MNDGITKAWAEYQAGIDFKNRINLFGEVQENYRFFEGDQWSGISAPNLPTPVFNIIKPIGNFKVAQVKDRKLLPNVQVKYMPEVYTLEDSPEQIKKVILRQVNDYAKFTWNRLKMDFHNMEGLLDAFCSGDYILYNWWNPNVETGQPFKGDVDIRHVDNVSYFPGNPNIADVQSQPYIILAFRELLENVKKLAKGNPLIDSIVSDEETEYQASDTAMIELDTTKKCTVLLKMWKENEKVMFAKYTRYVEIQPPTDSGLKLYPLAMMNWTPKKNCCHGVANVTYLKANQVYINKQMAFTQLYLLQTAYPKVLFNKTVIPEWSNKVAAAIGVNGPVDGMAKYLNPPTIPFDVWKGFQETISKTMELDGANDPALGNISNPDNTSAFIAIREAAIVPLQLQQERFYTMMRDLTAIWLDFWLANYPDGRDITIMIDGQPVTVPFEAAKYKDILFDVNIEIGEAQMWSEVNTVKTLDALLQGGQIKLSQYYKRMPDGYIPEKQELYEQALQDEQMAEQMAAQQAQGEVMSGEVA